MGGAHQYQCDSPTICQVGSVIFLAWWDLPTMHIWWTDRDKRIQPNLVHGTCPLFLLRCICASRQEYTYNYSLVSRPSLRRADGNKLGQSTLEAGNVISVLYAYQCKTCNSNVIINIIVIGGVTNMA